MGATVSTKKLVAAFRNRPANHARYCSSKPIRKIFNHYSSGCLYSGSRPTRRISRTSATAVENHCWSVTTTVSGRM